MIDVTRIGNTDGVVITLNNGEGQSLIDALDFYLHDMDANERDYGYADIRDLRDKIKEELK